MNAKILKRLKKMGTLKSEKTKLKDKIFSMINKCSNRSELKGIEKTLSYYSVLKDDEHWDEGYFFNLIEFKLKRMSNYFHTHNIVADEDWYGTLCDRAIAILNAGYKTNIITDKDLHNYVNTRNVNRFFNPKELDFILKEGLQKYYLPTVREKKAKALFWKFLHHYIEYLWD